jgi:cytochrome c oxidase subunit II
MARSGRPEGRWYSAAGSRPERDAGDPEKRENVRKKLLWALALVAFALLLSACSSGDKPQNTFDTAGPTAAKEKNLIVPVFWVAAVVFVIVEGGILWIALRFRHKKGRDRMPPQVHGNTRLEIGWTILPTLVLAFVMVPTVSTLWDLARTPSDAMNVTVKGYQWWWGFEYTDDDMRVSYGDNEPITTADVLVIPAGRTVYLSLESDGGGAKDADGNPDHMVVHSFWAPRLFGKQDVVPTRTNHITFSADQPGTYWGQCAEFCGLQHGRMKFRIVALSETDWTAWVANQKQPSARPTDPLAKHGMDLFLNGVSSGVGQCIACHAIGGTPAAATAAPNLTHFFDQTHQCFAGCDFETNDEAALRAWLTDPNAVKLGAKMPDYQLTPEEIDALVAYLHSLT